jgi:two-component system, OmpR family, sensor histidine kinase KdpD
MTAIGRYLHVNPTTVALMFLVAVLLTSAYWGLRHALPLAIVATATFNFFFLPPVGTFTIADPQNWVALFAFLVTALVASNLAERARSEAERAKQRRREVERLYALSQQLLGAENVAELLNALPRYISDSFVVEGAALLLPERTTIYRSRLDLAFDEDILRSVLGRGEPTTTPTAAYVPLRIGVRTVGALAIIGADLSRETLDAVGSLAGLAIERVRAIEALTNNRAMQENERLRSALLDSVTHEFRTPLTGIKASVTSLLSGPALDDAQRKELLTVIDEETDRLNRLVGEAAEMGELDSGMFKLNLQLHEIGSVIKEAIADASTVLQDHEMQVVMSDGPPRVRMDAERIREVLGHLLENAAKYSEPGTPIRVTAESEADKVIVSVSDRGPGIDSFEQNLIFDKFYRGRNQRYAAPGTGMGLAIARVIIEAHGGTLGVTSQLGSGSVFSFSLPVENRG